MPTGTSPSPASPTATGASPSSTSGTTCWSTASPRRSGWPAATTVDLGAARHQPVADQHLHRAPSSTERQRRLGTPTKPGLALVPTNNRFRDGSYSNFNNTDLDGQRRLQRDLPALQLVRDRDRLRRATRAPACTWSTTRAARPTAPSCGGIAGHGALRRPPTSPALHGQHRRAGPRAHEPAGAGRVLLRHRRLHRRRRLPSRRAAPVAPPAASTRLWFGSEGWQGFSGQNNFIEFGKKPYAPARPVASTARWSTPRPGRSTIPQLLVHTSGRRDVPGVTVNLYQEGRRPTAAPSLTLVDTTKTSSWDDWAQGFRSDGIPQHELPRPAARPHLDRRRDLFFFSLYNQPDWLDLQQRRHARPTPLPVQLAVQVLRRHAQLEPGAAGALRRHVPVPQRHRLRSRPPASPTRHELHGLRGRIPDASPIRIARHPHAPRRQVRGRGGRAPGLRAGEGGGQEHPHRRQLHRAGDPGVRRPAATSSSCPTRPQVCRLLQRQQRPESDHRPWARTTLPSHEGDTGSVESLLAVRGRRAHRPRLHQPVPGVRARWRRSPAPPATCAIARR